MGHFELDVGMHVTTCNIHRWHINEFCSRLCQHDTVCTIHIVVFIAAVFNFQLFICKLAVLISYSSVLSSP
jgi:hypothetical protein